MKNNLRKSYLKAMKAICEYHEAIGDTIEGINEALNKLFGDYVVFVGLPNRERPYELHLYTELPGGANYHKVELPNGEEVTLYQSHFADAALVKKSRCDFGHLVVSIFALKGVHIINDVDITITSKNADTINVALLNELSALQKR